MATIIAGYVLGYGNEVSLRTKGIVQQGFSNRTAFRLSDYYNKYRGGPSRLLDNLLLKAIPSHGVSATIGP